MKDNQHLFTAVRIIPEIESSILFEYELSNEQIKLIVDATIRKMGHNTYTEYYVHMIRRIVMDIVNRQYNITSREEIAAVEAIVLAEIYSYTDHENIHNKRTSKRSCVCVIA